MSPEERWHEAALAGALALVCPERFGGLRLIAPAGPVRDAWLKALIDLAGTNRTPVYVPASVTERQLSGGLAIARSVASGKAEREIGLLERASERLLIVNMAERLGAQSAALIAASMDETLQSDRAAFCTILLDEGETLEEAPPSILTERLAFQPDLRNLPIRTGGSFLISGEDVESATRRFPTVSIREDYLEAIVATTAFLGIRSMRMPLFCASAAKAIAALNGSVEVALDDLSLACRLVLPIREDISQQPSERQNEEPPPPRPSNEENSEDQNESDSDNSEQELSLKDLEDMLIDAVQTQAGMSLQRNGKRRPDRRNSGIAGRSGAYAISLDRGRPDRAMRRQLGRGRIDLLTTLRTAVPLQNLRNRSMSRSGLDIRASDIRMKQFRRRKQSSVIFVVDASGSSAMNRLSEAKGAATQLLSDCYSRRDLVSLISFRGTASELVLLPTRSLVRARRGLSDIPGGGGTPLPDALSTAYRLALSEDARGRTPFLVILSDGRGNIALDGSPDKQAVTTQTKALARQIKSMAIDGLFFDISKRGDRRAEALADDLGTAYHFLPIAKADAVSRLVRDRIGRT